VPYRRLLDLNLKAKEAAAQSYRVANVDLTSGKAPSAWENAFSRTQRWSILWGRPARGSAPPFGTSRRVAEAGAPKNPRDPRLRTSLGRTLRGRGIPDPLVALSERVVMFDK
jgi:hypothetical protein